MLQVFVPGWLCSTVQHPLLTTFVDEGVKKQNKRFSFKENIQSCLKFPKCLWKKMFCPEGNQPELWVSIQIGQFNTIMKLNITQSLQTLFFD